MPNKRNAIKELRKAEKRNVINLRKKRTIKSLAKEILAAVDANDLKKAQELFPGFQKAVDKAAKTGVIKKNTAARKKSRINKKIAAKA